MTSAAHGVLNFDMCKKKKSLTYISNCLGESTEEDGTENASEG